MADVENILTRITRLKALLEFLKTVTLAAVAFLTGAHWGKSEDAISICADVIISLFVLQLIIWLHIKKCERKVEAKNNDESRC